MEFKGMLDAFYGPAAPNELKNLIHQNSFDNLTEDEAQGFGEAFSLIIQFSKINPLPDNLPIMIIYITEPELTLLPAKNIGGQFAHLVLICLYKLREEKRSRASYMMVMLEELLHGLYHIRNEYVVKKLAIEIAQLRHKLTLHECYPSMFDEHDRPKYCSDYAEDYYEITKLTPP